MTPAHSDEIEDLTPAQTLIEKAERIVLAFFYFLLLALTISNFW